MKERLIIIVVALVAGLFITSAGFFIYQSTKARENAKPIVKTAQNEPVKQANPDKLFVKVTDPTDESLTDNRTLEVKGSTNPGNLILVSTNTQDVSGQSTTDGNFSITTTIDAGANELIVRAIAPNGDSVSTTKTITYSTDEF